MPTPPKPIELKESITRVLTDFDSPLWFPDSTRALAEAEWRRLKNEVGITKGNYGTARMILKDIRAAREIAFSFPVANQNANLSCETISVELLPRKINDDYEKSGAQFYCIEEIFAEARGDDDGEIETINCLRDAFDFIGLLPSLYSTVNYLVRSIHLIKPETDDHDTSFSEPDISFSIFVSVPRKNTVVNALRVAEAIVHEAMHLQLTLIEKISPLAAPAAGDFYYSPWKEEFRSPQGILHALYVFRVIECFFAKVLKRVLLPPEAAAHAAARRDEINWQIEMIEDFAESGELTPLGAIFARRLIEKVN